jgi:hypothetical protein
MIANHRYNSLASDGKEKNAKSVSEDHHLLCNQQLNINTS